MNGPYQTEREAREAARAIVAGPDIAVSAEGNRRLLEDACTAAGVTLGAWDHRIVLWLAGYEPSTCAVVAGLITRAAASKLPASQLPAVLAALDDAATLRTERAGAYCYDCNTSPAGLCLTHTDDLDQADAYRHVARELGGDGAS